MSGNIQGMKWFLQPNIFLKNPGEPKIYSPAVGTACPCSLLKTHICWTITCSVPEKGFYIGKWEGKEKKKREETKKEKEAKRQVKNLFPYNVYLVKSDCLLKIGNK